jgi:hypothetical protein
MTVGTGGGTPVRVGVAETVAGVGGVVAGRAGVGTGVGTGVDGVGFGRAVGEPAAG